MKGFRKDLIHESFNQLKKNTKRLLKETASKQASRIIGKDKIKNKERQFLCAMILNAYTTGIPLSVIISTKSVTILPPNYYLQGKLFKEVA